MKTLSYKVDRRNDGTRLLSFLADSMGTSRKQAKQLLDSRAVLVNGRRVWMARHPLRTGHEVTVTPESPAPPAGGRATVLFESENYLVVDKPAGHLSDGDDSIESRLRELRTEPALRAAHRLDRDTTGCLIMARSEQAFDAIVGEFLAQEQGLDTTEESGDD